MSYQCGQNMCTRSGALLEKRPKIPRMKGVRHSRGCTLVTAYGARGAREYDDR